MYIGASFNDFCRIYVTDGIPYDSGSELFSFTCRNFQIFFKEILSISTGIFNRRHQQVLLNFIDKT